MDYKKLVLLFIVLDFYIFYTFYLCKIVFKRRSRVFSFGLSDLQIQLQIIITDKIHSAHNFGEDKREDGGEDYCHKQ